MLEAAAALSFASVDDKMMSDFLAGVVERWGDPYDGHSGYVLGLYAFACFPYLSITKRCQSHQRASCWHPGELDKHLSEAYERDMQED